MRRQVLTDVVWGLKYFQWLGYDIFPFKMSPIVMATENGIKKARMLNILRQEIGTCSRCSLHRMRTNIVFGEGNPDAVLMFIGEGPGQEEDLQGRPFVGRAGQLLTSLIKNLSMKREDVYIANVVKCRPPMNRAPKPEEIQTCLPFLLKQIEIISPKVIITLGDVATRALLNTKAGITAVRGKVYEFMGAKVVPTFHPAYLLRNPSQKKLTWADAQKAINLLKKL